MTAAMAMPGNTAETFLVHFFGTGLTDDRYVVERFKARADGDIVPAPVEALAAEAGRKVKRTTATLKAVRDTPSQTAALRALRCGLSPFFMVLSPLVSHPAMVRLPPQDPGGGRPLGSGPLGHHELG